VSGERGARGVDPGTRHHDGDNNVHVPPSLPLPPSLPPTGETLGTLYTIDIGTNIFKFVSERRTSKRCARGRGGRKKEDMHAQRSRILLAATRPTLLAGTLDRAMHAPGPAPSAPRPLVTCFFQNFTDQCPWRLHPQPFPISPFSLPPPPHPPPAPP